MLPILLSFVLFAQQPAPSLNDFNGDWTTDLSTLSKEPEPERVVVKGKRFSRSKGAVSVPADGQFHSLGDVPYVDAVAVTILDRRRVRELDRFRGKIIYSITYAASGDGQSMRRTITDFGKPNGRAVSTVIDSARDGRHSPGEHLVSGAWRAVSIKKSQTGLIDTIRLRDGRYSLLGHDGYGYTAVIGGPPVSIRGDAETGRVSVTTQANDTVIVRMSLDGKKTALQTLRLQPDRHTIKVSVHREADGVEKTYLLRRVK
ncbi:hypothetical protein [Sphingomonas sp. UYP23]